jgi:rhodanese-related sulfurtransferase
MPQHRNSSHRSSHRSSQKSPATFSATIRRPIVQVGILVLAVLIYVIVATVTNGRITRSGLPAEVKVDVAYSLYQEGAFLLDVRELSEWDEYHAPGATLIPLGELSLRLNEVPRDHQIVVVCHSGNRSQQGRNILLQAGFTQVTSMSGGMNAWRTAGFPTEP